MKKILTTILLLAFCTVQATWAGEVIIVGSSGQAKYENESKNIPTIQTNNGGYSKMDSTGNNKNVSKSVKVINNWINKTFEHDLIKYVNNIPEEITDYNSLLQQYGYELKDNGFKKHKRYTTVELLDGDYVKQNGDDYQIMAEYHKDGTIFGLIKKNSKEYFNGERINMKMYSEYRINSNNKAELKHIMFEFSTSYTNGSLYSPTVFSQSIYNKKGELLCRRLNFKIYDRSNDSKLVETVDNIYIAKDTRNMISNLSKKHTYISRSENVKDTIISGLSFGCLMLWTLANPDDVI